MCAIMTVRARKAKSEHVLNINLLVLRASRAGCGERQALGPSATLVSCAHHRPVPPDAGTLTRRPGLTALQRRLARPFRAGPPPCDVIAHVIELKQIG